MTEQEPTIEIELTEDEAWATRRALAGADYSSVLADVDVKIYNALSELDDPSEAALLRETQDAA